MTKTRSTTLVDGNITANKIHTPQLDKLRQTVETCRSPGWADYNKYSRGMANGLILALAILDGDSMPDFLPEPNPETEKRTKELQDAINKQFGG